MDQITCIKICVKNEIKCADAFRMLTVAYGEATLDRSNVYRWYKIFSEGREDVNDEERAGRLSTSITDEKINEVEKMILANRRITVREVAEDLNISIGSGVVYHEFLPQGRTVNKEYYLQVMRKLRETIRQKRPDLWKNKNWLLHHDNAPAHTSLLVRDLLAKNNTLMMPRIHRFPRSGPLRFLNLKYIDKDDLEQYFKEKSALAKKLNLDKTLLLEALTDGMPDYLKKYLIAARVQEPSEWYKITTQLKLSTNKEEEPQQPSTSTSTPVKNFNSNSSKAHQYQPFPRTAAATHHQQEPHKSINQPPYPCKICASHQLPNQIHFHRDCPLKNNNHPKRINPDASSLGVAGVLKQPDEQGILHPIGYFSRKLHPYEQNYTASEIETLAIINSVQRFHTYLHNIHFTLHTDHLPLKWIKNVKNPQDKKRERAKMEEQTDHSNETTKSSLPQKEVFTEETPPQRTSAYPLTDRQRREQADRANDSPDIPASHGNRAAMWPKPCDKFHTFDLTSSRQCSRQQATINFTEATSVYKLYMERLQRQQEYNQRPSLLTELSSKL
ncbi:hypothetical protein LAZ67_19000948 [Cordylochernes scorpioides]|uniref:Reverse transcriptase RNase H-like domain-containing protein n=1 Tax=Cordylochernes scorpioides TaxID=51811 RepID=A0ABY6LL71_9ARAC|nr:hypothetical protein LAZ67_19000948 [Cordylochernes scorpioides]